MDIRSIANAASSVVNGNVPITIKRSTGYTIGPGRRQVPTYQVTTGWGQVQALTGDDLKQLDGLNIQGIVRAIIVRGPLQAVSRPDQTGGDIITIDGHDWLVVQILEAWQDWTRAVIRKQT